MKAIDIKNLKKELKQLEASKAQTENILNIVGIYNQILELFLAGDVKKMYAISQLSGQYNKLYETIKKAQERKQKTIETAKKKEAKQNPPKDEDDLAFDDMINNLKRKG